MIRYNKIKFLVARGEQIMIGKIYYRYAVSENVSVDSLTILDDLLLNAVRKVGLDVKTESHYIHSDDDWAALRSRVDSRNVKVYLGVYPERYIQCYTGDCFAKSYPISVTYDGEWMLEACKECFVLEYNSSLQNNISEIMSCVEFL